jgi:hypothetical protein
VAARYCVEFILDRSPTSAAAVTIDALARRGRQAR